MTDDLTPNDDHRGMARRAGYEVYQVTVSAKGFEAGWYIGYEGPDPARRTLRDYGPFDNEADAWARAVALATEFRNGA